MNRECLEYSAQSEQVSIRLCLYTDFLKPIGYEMENGVRHIILLVFASSPVKIIGWKEV